MTNRESTARAGAAKRSLTFKHFQTGKPITVGLLVDERLEDEESDEGDEVLESVNTITQTVNEVMNALSKTAETCETTEPFVEEGSYNNDPIDF